MKAEKKSNVLVAMLLWILSLSVLAPLALIIVNAFKTSAEATVMTLTLPEKWQFGNIARIFEEAKVGRTLLNSVFISVLSVSGSVFLGLTAGYALSRRRDRINKAIHALFMMGMIVPTQIIAVIQLMQKLHLMNTYAGIIFVYITMYIPQTIFLSYSFVSTIPKEMDEAAIEKIRANAEMYVALGEEYKEEC